MDDVDIDDVVVTNIDVDDKVVLTFAIADDDFESVAIVVVGNDVGETESPLLVLPFEFPVLGFIGLSIFLNIALFVTE